MTALGLQISARSAFRAVLAVGLLVMLGANLPGHLSYDSVAQLYEGHFHLRETWGPALYAWILGAFDRFIPGTALYVTASAALFYASLASLSDLRPRTSWLAVAVTAPIMLIPQVLIYQAIVWKDVAFANCAVAGLICVAHAARVWPNARRRWFFLAAAVVLLAVASQVRQNGIIAAVFAALAVGWIGSRGRWLRGAVWAVGGLLAVVVAGQVFTALSIPPNSPPDPGVKTGLRIVQNYDLLGAAALDPNYRLDEMAAAAPADTALIEARARFDYSGRRVDFIDRDKALTDALWRVPDGAANRQWAKLILKRPDLYLRVRLEDFRWVFAPPVIDWCLPVYVGVDAPAEKMAPLKLDHRFVESDAQLNNYASWFMDTPVDWHWFYAGISLALAGLFLWRRQPADIAMAALQLAGAAFAASFFIISIACDYRYLYFTDLAALAGLIYAAIDPPVPWRKRV
ncbi:MAG: hypothetical protein JWP28_2950 [Phenylobacterium sp.]|uniref:hypothetical protein n=1 Tax=Phenylobacterium sp. TaxID=1871053 RepID=UPI00263A1013|nr:hypothetical protein [Phenylobacterium sp.]MDB5498919.1 hypothetical protein [Phenylobacterium sp.]